MKIKCLGSGSSGNCYIVEKDGKRLILDCGVPKKEILVGIDFDISNVEGCVVTHSHSDHSRGLKEVRNMCIKTFLPYETEHNSQIQVITFGIFNIYAFPLPHNGTKNYGFVVEAGGEKLLYMTDFEYCSYGFKSENIDHLIIECNYREEFLDKNLPNYEHKVLGHCSFVTCQRFIENNQTENLKTVILTHMGDCCGDMNILLSDIKKSLNKSVFCVLGVKGVEVEV